jgi:hypothetical protein
VAIEQDTIIRCAAEVTVRDVFFPQQDSLRQAVRDLVETEAANRLKGSVRNGGRVGWINRVIEGNRAERNRIVARRTGGSVEQNSHLVLGKRLGQGVAA